MATSIKFVETYRGHMIYTQDGKYKIKSPYNIYFGGRDFGLKAIKENIGMFLDIERAGAICIWRQEKIK